MVAVLGYSTEQIREAVKEMYTIVANRPQTPLHFPTGADACKKALYPDELVRDLPQSALESFAGVGCPFQANVIKPGDTVLDVGSGSGTDVLIAAELVGEQGRVIALDLTPAMRDKLSALIKEQGIDNIEILSGDAEQIALPDHSVDVVTSNGVLNLVAGKRRAIGEIFRVVKPGGHVQIADIVIASPVTPDCEDDPKLWAECVVGATVDEDYLNMFRDAGFEDVEILRDYDYFAYSPSKETQEVAKQFGAHAYELRMRRGSITPSKLAQFAKRADPRRIVKSVRRRGLSGMVGLGLALLACYGTLAVVAIFSLLGVTLAFNEGVWAGAIVGAAVLTTIIIALGLRKYTTKVPIILALIGTALLTYTMFINYSIVVELVGFVFLGTGAWADYNARRWAKVPKEKTKKQTRRNSFTRPETLV